MANIQDEVGSGYTVEGQKTGEEKHGGLQIEIIPSFRRNLRTWLKEEDAQPKVWDPSAVTSMFHSGPFETSTPKEQGLIPGDVIRSYPDPAFKTFEYHISDMVGGDDSNVTFEVFCSSPGKFTE